MKQQGLETIENKSLSIEGYENAEAVLVTGEFNSKHIRVGCWELPGTILAWISYISWNSPTYETMKKIALFVVAALLMSTGLMGQKQNALKTDLFSAFLRTGVLKYERALNENMSLQIGGFYTGYSPGDTEARLSGIGITPEFRYYLSEKNPAPHGTYLAPNARYMKLTVEDQSINEEASLTSFGFAINLGHQAVFKDIIVIDGWIGPAYAFRNLDDPSGEIDTGISSVNGFGLRVGVAIGIVF